MAGPLPETNRRRRNTPTIPTTTLPAAGRKGTTPRPPKWVELSEAGRAWWKWAWRTPQAAAWSPGDLVAIARRATIEDDLATYRDVQNLDIAELLETPADDRTKLLEFVMRSLHSLAAGKLAIAREARELDDRLGLTPKAMAALRWKIEETKPNEPAAADGSEVTHLDDRRRRLIDAS